MTLTRTTRTPRLQGYVAHVGTSRSAGYWAIIKSGNREYFAYGRSFLSHPSVPWLGQRVTFTALPSGPGRMQRATEVAIVTNAGHVVAVHANDESGWYCASTSTTGFRADHEVHISDHETRE